MGQELRDPQGEPETPAERALEGLRGALKELGDFSSSTYRLTMSFLPVLKLLSAEQDITEQQLTRAIDTVFEELYGHPLTRSTGRVTSYLRERRLLPNEQSTEGLIRALVQQVMERSPVPVPEPLVQEFWRFFDELFSTPELKGLGELSFDMARLVLRTYEPTLVEVVNLLKGGRRHSEEQRRQVLLRARMVRADLTIIRRQVTALRYIGPFFQTNPKDFKSQAQIVARMVREFGPFFVKMAQVAAANADFLPEEIGRELAVFHEDVAPMDEAEVNQAFMESFGVLPDKLFMDFDARSPVRSGSIGSVYVAKKPFRENGREVLQEVVVKVGRHNLDREFTMGRLVLGLAILSSQLWAPHSKLEPFLRAMQQQVDEFVTGFLEELDFASEAQNHQRAYERSLGTGMWKVPALYGHTRRILQMEYLSHTHSLGRVVTQISPRRLRRFQARVSESLLHTIASQLLLYGELHGDLHPGNIMVAESGELYLIDWGNVVRFEGKWGLVGSYLMGAVLGDTQLLADTLVHMSVDPEQSAARRAEIKGTLDATLAKKDVVPLTRQNFIGELRRGGATGLVRRGRAVLQLMGNTQQVGVVLSREYLHLSRSLFAAAGSFGALYTNTPKVRMARDVARSLGRLPSRLGRELARHELRKLRRGVRSPVQTLRSMVGA